MHRPTFISGPWIKSSWEKPGAVPLKNACPPGRGRFTSRSGGSGNRNRRLTSPKQSLKATKLLSPIPQRGDNLPEFADLAYLSYFSYQRLLLLRPTPESIPCRPWPECVAFHRKREADMRVPLSRSRLFLALGILGLATLAICWGRGRTVPQAAAQPPVQVNTNQNPANFGQPTGLDNTKRVVAYLYDTVPLTRAEYGDYLIERQGAERLDNFINRRIIEMACQQKGVDVTAAEVEAEFASMLAGLNLTPARFESTMLKPYHKTLYEWKEDAFRP